MVKASDCKCCVCGVQAVAFWPCFDPDIPQHPYCRKCLDKEKLKALIAICGDEDGRKHFARYNKEHKDGKAKKTSYKRKKAQG